MSEEIKENIKAYYIGSDIDKVLDYIQQKENIIKEVREYIKGLKNFKIKYVMFEEKELYASENNFIKELLEILDKEKV